MPILELKTPEAKYTNDMSRNGHFAIDCSCGGKEGKYGGSHYENGQGKDLERSTKNYVPLHANKFEHTFYLSEYLFIDELFMEHKEKEKEPPLILVCNDCGRKFSFTHESYLNLRSKMMAEYNNRLLKKR